MSINPNDLWNKLPLAEAFWQFLGQVWPDDELDAAFDQHRGRHYQRELSFAEIVHLVLDSLTLARGRVHPVLRDKPKLKATKQAYYGKIARMPTAVSHAMVSADAAKLRPLLPAAMAHPQSKTGLGQFRHLVFDGHTLKRGSKRLKAVRGTPGRPLAAKLLAVLELQSDLVVGLASDKDAHANDQALLPDALAQVRSTLPGPKLWIGDRQFGNLANFKRCAVDGDHCLLRKTSQATFTPDADPARTGQDEQGRSWIDEKGLFSSTREGEQAARRITVTRSGQPPLVLVTSLLDADEFPANDLLELYRQRWSIERKFQTVGKLFATAPSIAGQPDGAVFQAALTLLLANNLQTLQTILAGEQEKTAASVSTQNLHDALRKELEACRLLMTVEDLAATLKERLPPSDGDEWMKTMRSLLKQAWRPAFEKSVQPGRKYPPKVKHRRGTAGHFSVGKALADAKAKAKKAKPNDQD
jgi:hypothetical protein